MSLPSPSPGLLAPKRALQPSADCPQPPAKRPKTDQDDARDGCSRLAVASGSQSDNQRRAAAARLCALEPDHSPRPQTCCCAELECGHTLQHDLPNPGLIAPYPYQLSRYLPQSILSSSPSTNHIPSQHAGDHQEALQDAIPQLVCYATQQSEYIASPFSSTAPLNPPSTLSAPRDTSPMNHLFVQGSSRASLFNNYPGPVYSNTSEAPSCNSGILDSMFGPFDGGDLPQELMSPYQFPDTADNLSPLMASFEMTQFDSASPFSRSLSRSTCSSATDASSPLADYATPTSDSTVTTPSPSETCGLFSAEYGERYFELGFGGKAKPTHEHLYVPGSAPLSPDGSSGFSFDFSLPPQTQTITSTASTRSIAEARRHSEPANVAALRIAPFFAPSHGVPEIAPNPTSFLTLPITDYLASTPAASGSHSALPSSIAPNQLQKLPELMHPKPVRAFKPPILLSKHQYDPKDFVRRRSEPILPLPTLDVASHLPLDVSPEEDEEEDDEMDIEGAAFDEEEEVGCDDVLDPSALYEGMNLDTFLATVSEVGFEFDPNWTWPQDADGLTATDCVDMFENGFDWTLDGASHMTSGPDLGSGPVSWDTVLASN